MKFTKSLLDRRIEIAHYQTSLGNRFYLVIMNFDNFVCRAKVPNLQSNN